MYGGPLLTNEYPIKYSLQWFFTKNPSWGFWQFFFTGTYEGLGTMCVKSETRYEKYHEKKKKNNWDLLRYRNCFESRFNQLPIFKL